MKQVSVNQLPSSYAERLLGALRLFAEHSDVLTIKEVGEKLGLPPSSAHRVLEPLVELGLVERAPQRRYRIGTEFFRIAMRVQDRFEIVSLARPLVEEAAERTGETCLLALLAPSRRRIVLAYKADTKLPLRFKFDLLENITPAWGSLGRAIMAWLSPTDLARIIEEAGPSPVTGQMLPSLDQLQKEFVEIRRRGVASSKGQRGASDAYGISAPFFDANGQVRGAIGVVAPEFRVGQDAAANTAQVVKRQAAELSRLCGHRVNETRTG
ncbi:IclR family transcriptional regulator [Propylenella binzhouense]|uniref:IclR family transcriptional regulator n=1 Tax=Propylenella binzhouense TaxID=2555902 RepID=A0A964T637_9HYPH|nr:IclR family transcriptional regulator [Propylenella binzhouense]MYZ48587.1 IclR family transcriptional regulator [Propylenella binzhouense]